MRASLFALLTIVIAVSPACMPGTGSNEWPTRPVKVIVPFGPGSGRDVVIRLLAPRLSERWHQPVIIDNRPGPDGIVGVQAFVSARDRHTLLFTPAGQVILSPLLHDQLPFDPARDLVPVAAAIRPSIGIAVAANVDVASLPDLARLARRQPDGYLWAGVPGLPEIIFKAFLALENVRVKHVPYRDLSMALPQELTLHGGGPLSIERNEEERRERGNEQTQDARARRIPSQRSEQAHMTVSQPRRRC